MLDTLHHPTIVPAYIAQAVSLQEKNWFKTGGIARYYCEPTTAHEFQQAIAFANAHALPLFVLGEGANILISDDGFDGLVIKPCITTVNIHYASAHELLVTVGAGMPIHAFITWCLEHNIGGFEEFSGIPGTIGGAVYINLHYFEFLLDQFLVAATVIEKATGALHTVDAAWFNFGYNQSTLLEKNFYVVDATFKLKKLTDLETAFAQGRRQEIIRHRMRRYPVSNTCGSFFRNFLPDEVTHESNGKKIIFVAYYLDKVGVKGELSHGNAIVSHQHANMLVTKNGATSNDVIQLARTMQKLVNDQFGITPQPECQLIGFKKYPLL